MIPKSNNIVLFPRSYRDIPLQSIEQIIDHVAENRKEHITYLVDDIAEYVFQRADLEGFHVTAREYTKSSGLFIEAMRAMLYRSAELEHPLHKITEDIITIDDEPEEEDSQSPDI